MDDVGSPLAIGGSVTSNAMAVDAGGSSWLSGCPSCSQKTSRGLLSCVRTAGVYPSLACSRETFLPTCKYYLHTHTHTHRAYVRATDSRVYVYIELARDDCRTLAARAAAPIKTPLLEALSSARCLLCYVLFVLRTKEPRLKPTETGNQGKKSEEASVLLPCVLAPASPVSFLPRRRGTGRGLRTDV